MIEVSEWTKNDRSLFARWPDEPSNALPCFLLRSADEPWYIRPQNLAIRSSGCLLGRFTYRVSAPGGSAFIGMAINPDFRGRGLSGPALRASLLWLASRGIGSAYATVAIANTPSLNMLSSALFLVNSLEWRDMPAGTNVDVFDLAKFPPNSYTLRPFSMLYARLSVLLSPDMYFVARSVGSYHTGVAQR